ncbi:hypothetical protein [Crateriforma conspicua]|uniref:MraY-like glycosyltransferase n=1 Tax=Crateriforma conspicua TaxID=2527996 RepID=A0A5C5YCJ5_9PLAN|nr:hypothetical protein [Crateriforma conspicua]TWT72648.1 MraY-like glycosyltransferase [Crateriforma conspicua]
MPLPDFNADEQYLINCIKSPNASANSGSYMWGYIIGGALVAGFAAYYENILMMLGAFVIVCGFRIYEERFQSRWMPHWRSIIEKYESAANASAPDATELQDNAEN